MKLIPCILSLLVCSTAHADDGLTIASDHVEYTAGQVNLCGRVHATHQLGKLSAEKACLLSGPDKGREHYSLLQLFDRVHISLTEGGNLACERADINSDELTGNFRGAPGNPFAVYSHMRYSSEGTYLPLEIQSELISLQVNSDERGGGRSPKHYLSNLVAQGSVSMRYNHNFAAKADRAIYRDTNRPIDSCEDRLSGMIYLVPDGPKGICEVCHGQGDRIRARLIRIDADNETLFFDRPKGQVFLQQEDGMLDRIDFASEALFWDESNHHLTLQHNVELHDLGMGALQAEEEVSVAFDPSTEEHEVLWIRAHGPTHLVFEGEDPEDIRQLYCFDGLEVDNKRFQVVLKSPTVNDKILPGKQIRYKDRVGEVNADVVTIHYQSVAKELQAERILIEGNVYIVNHAPFDPEDTRPVLQYAKADAVEYFPQEQVMMLMGKGRRVLFFDKLNNIQVSAPAIKMSRDQVTGKEAVQGIGDVRMRLIGQEMDDLLQTFEDYPGAEV